MKRYFNIKDIATRSKKYLLAGLAFVIAAGIVTSPASAIGGDASGNVGYTAYGLQRSAKFKIDGESNKCTTKWDVTGNYNIAFNLTGDPTQYTHDLFLNQSGNSLKGWGGYPVGGPQTYGWKLTSGNVSGSNINFSAKYILGADALTPLTTMSVTGTIAPDGSMSGTWSDNYQGGNRTGDWETTSGAAVQNVVGCDAEGNFKYTDVDGNNYKVDVRFAKFSGGDVWFAGPVQSGNVGAGQWLFAKAHDGGGDQIWGSFATKEAAKLGVALMSTPADGPFAVTSGNIFVD